MIRVGIEAHVDLADKADERPRLRLVYWQYLKRLAALIDDLR